MRTFYTLVLTEACDVSSLESPDVVAGYRKLQNTLLSAANWWKSKQSPRTTIYNPLTGIIQKCLFMTNSRSGQFSGQSGLANCFAYEGQQRQHSLPLTFLKLSAISYA